jgi:hypothetical protein
MRAASVLAIMLLVLAAAPAAANAPLFRQVWAPYLLASPGDAVAVEIERVSASGGDPLRLGGVRLDLWPDETSVSVHIYEDGGVAVAARWLALDGLGHPVASGRFCQSAVIPLLPGAAELWILPSTNPLPCLAGAPAAKGVVYAFISPSTHTTGPNPLPRDGWLRGTQADICGLALVDAKTTTEDRSRSFCHRSDLAPDLGNVPPLFALDWCWWGDGFILTIVGIMVRACVNEAWLSPPAPPPVGTPTTSGCGGPGLVVHWMGGHAGGCGDAGVAWPTFECWPVSTCIGFSLTDCGPQQIDPTLYFFGGAVWACFEPQFAAPSQVPGPGPITPSGCSGSLGAGITAMGGGAKVCVETGAGWDPPSLGGLNPSVTSCPNGPGFGVWAVGAGTETCAS